jgi:hypothetical protein
MRALAACFTVFLGLSATAVFASMAGCSDSTDASSGGAGGAVASAGAGGAVASAGAGGQVATAGAGGGVECSFTTDTCQGCILAKCQDLAIACGGDKPCKDALGVLPNCACSSTNIDDCKNTFVSDGGDPAGRLVDCYTVNCIDSCEN